MSSLHDRLAEASDVFVAAGIPKEEAARDAGLLARHVLGWDRAALVTRLREPPPAGFTVRYQPVVDRRAAREPIAYIVGRQEFWGLEFEVTRDVLIPRPETELIVEEAIAYATEELDRPLRIADVGTGSACIAIAMASELPEARIVATDVSRSALAVARRNLRRHDAAARVALVETDLLAGVSTVDLIVSNPPYVAGAAREALPPEVGAWEPPGALFGGADGRTVLERLFLISAAHLAPGGRLVVEFGFDQEAWLRGCAAETGWQIVDIVCDLQSIPRVAVVRR